MKTALLAMLFLVPAFVKAQGVPDTIKLGQSASEVKAMLEDGYTMANGWTVKVGDTLQLGMGTLPTHAFSYIYESPLAMGNLYNTGKNYLPSNAAKYAIVKELITYGTKRHGFVITAKVGVGQMSNYWIELDNASAVGELVVPAAYAAKPSAPPAAAAPAVSKADELKKWKDLLDAGAITKDEYDAQKKKILEQP